VIFAQNCLTYKLVAIEQKGKKYDIMKLSYE